MTRRKSAESETGSQLQPPDTSAPFAAPSPLLRGRYVIERIIDDDALASTSLGRDLVVDRIIAITALQPHLAERPAFVERFLETERRASALFHPNLVTIFDVGETDGLCWSAHEYCGGGPLRQRLPSRQMIPVWQVVSLLSQIGSALETLHQNGLVHGRLSPNSVQFDDAGGVKLGGLGLAAITELDGLPLSARESDAIAYLSSEQRDRGITGKPADQYALALIGAELLAGSWHTSAIGSGAQSSTDLVSYLRQTRGDIPQSTLLTLTRALHGDPERRFLSIGDFVLAISGGASESIGSAAQGRQVALEAPAIAGADPPALPHTEPQRVSPPANSAVRLGDASPTAPPARPISAAMGRVQTHTGTMARHVGQFSTRSRTHLSDAGTQWRTWFLRQHPADRILLASGAMAVLLAVALISSFLMHPPASIAAPAFEGVSTDVARERASLAGLQIQSQEEHSPSVPAGVVMHQDPPAGELSRVDHPVKLLVSSGPAPVPAPDITRRNLDAARQRLAAAGLTLGAVAEHDTNGQPWGTITAQGIPPGREIAPGSPVDVTIATAPWTAAPSLINRGIGEVEQDLAGRKLRLGRVETQPQPGRRAGIVLSQDPPPDTNIRQGTALNVVIAVPDASGTGR